MRFNKLLDKWASGEGPREASTSKDTYRVVSFGDSHTPELDAFAFAAFLDALNDQGADLVIAGGDIGEFSSGSGHPRAHIDLRSYEQDCKAVRKLFERVREVHKGPIAWLEGNHEDGVRRKLQKVAPTLTSLYANLPLDCGVDELGIEWIPDDCNTDQHRVALPWGELSSVRYRHGHDWASGKYPGAKAMSNERGFGVPTRFFHVHRTTMSERWIPGVGRLMGIATPCLRTRDTDWTRRAHGWCQGFGVDEYASDGSVNSFNVTIENGSCVWNGERYGRR